MLIILLLIILFYQLRIADEINLDKEEPYVEILEILENSVFVAKKAKTFEEEKKVAN
jgi:hypothetical protein